MSSDSLRSRRRTFLLPGWCLVLIALCGLPLGGVAQEAQNEAALEASLEQLKEDTLALNRDLLILEEELLYPASSQVAVYLSMDLGELFHLDSVRVQVDSEPVAAQLYTEAQREALHRGGVQRLYLGNLNSGAHEISAVFTGIGPDGRDYKRGTRLEVEKGQEPLILELKIVDSATKLQPTFAVEEWALQ